MFTLSSFIRFYRPLLARAIIKISPKTSGDEALVPSVSMLIRSQKSMAPGDYGFERKKLFVTFFYPNFVLKKGFEIKISWVFQQETCQRLQEINRTFDIHLVSFFLFRAFQHFILCIWTSSADNLPVSRTRSTRSFLCNHIPKKLLQLVGVMCSYFMKINLCDTNLQVVSFQLPATNSLGHAPFPLGNTLHML